METVKATPRLCEGNVPQWQIPHTEGQGVRIYNNNNTNDNDNNGPNGHLFYVDGDLMMRRDMLSIIMLPDGDLRIALHLVPSWILTVWGSVHIEETVVLFSVPISWRHHVLIMFISLFAMIYVKMCHTCNEHSIYSSLLIIFRYDSNYRKHYICMIDRFHLV